MSKVNFVSEFNMFMRYARDNNLSLRERMLWMALFYVANDRAAYNEQTQEYDWPDGYIQVSNNELNLYCCLDKRAIETLRNTLKQRGLIDFIAGQKNKRNPAYKIHYFSVHVGYKIVPNPPPNYAPNDAPNDVPNNEPNNVPRPTPFSKYNINADADLGTTEHLEEDDEEEEERSRAREAIQTAYRCSFGQNPTSPELDEMTRLSVMLHLSNIAGEIVKATALAAPTNRLAYFRSVCIDWEEHCLRTKDDLESHQTLLCLMKNYPDDAVEYRTRMLDDVKERRERYARMEESA